jgi:hypothetical protein
MPYFYYKKNFAYKWVPVKAILRPSKPAEGSEPNITGLQELKDGLEELTLTELVEQFPPPTPPPDPREEVCPVCKAPTGRGDDHHEECPRAVTGPVVASDRPSIGE